MAFTEMLAQIPAAGLRRFSSSSPCNVEYFRTNGCTPHTIVVGHRGIGKNVSPCSSGEVRLSSRPSVRENTIKSFTMAAMEGADYVEFDVQVTKDDAVIIFHDDIILAEGEVAKTIADITLENFRAYGPGKGQKAPAKALLRQKASGLIQPWNVDVDDYFCTLVEAFEQVPPSCGFNIEVKFGPHNWLVEAEIIRTVQEVIKVVSSHANGRTVYYSSFHPDAVVFLRKLQDKHPVFFLTDAAASFSDDPTRRSMEADFVSGRTPTPPPHLLEICGVSATDALFFSPPMMFMEAATEHALKNGLHGIVSEVKAVVERPSNAKLVKEAGLCLLTYGELNNHPNWVHFQQNHGIDGVIVDYVPEIVAAVGGRSSDCHIAAPTTPRALEGIPTIRG